MRNRFHIGRRARAFFQGAFFPGPFSQGPQASAPGETVVGTGEVPELDGLEALPADRPFFIFGTARGAGLLVEAGAAIGRVPVGFIDIERTDPFLGLPVCSVAGFAATAAPDTPVVLSNRFVRENALRLQAHGFSRLYNGLSLVRRLARRGGAPSEAEGEPGPIPVTPGSVRERLMQALALSCEPTTEAARYDLGELLFRIACPKYRLSEFGRTVFDDAAFAADYDRLVPDNSRSFDRKYVVWQLIQLLGGSEGDAAECGVYQGATAYLMAKAMAQRGMTRTLHLFDSLRTFI